MRTLFTSFGISRNPSENLSDPFFARLPPAQYSTTMGQFIPDYAPVLLASEMIVDAETMDQLSFRRRKHGAFFSGYHDMMEVLVGEGLARSEDYSSIIAQKDDALRREISNDVSYQGPN